MFVYNRDPVDRFREAPCSCVLFVAVVDVEVEGRLGIVAAILNFSVLNVYSGNLV